MAAAAGRLAAVDLFASLERRRRATRWPSPASDHLFAAGETVVRQGAAGDSMFVVLSGRVRVSIDPSGQEVAVIPAGGFFGEMSMLTGEARTATVKAIDDVMVLEISPSDFRALAEAQSGTARSRVGDRQLRAARVSKRRGPLRWRSPHRKRSRASWRACASSSLCILKSNYSPR